MKIITVRDLMVPLEEYATVPEEATLFEAVMTLERAQERLDRKRYKYLHRAILVYDKNRKVVGKISQLDVLRALEPKYATMERVENMSRGGFSPDLLKSILSDLALWDRPLRNICGKAAKVKVKEFMHIPTEGEYIEETASLEEAMHMLLIGHHQSLLVTKNGEIVGILRLTDVFMEIFRMMEICEF
ncbi:MAG: CBS domain-containing protein [Desulfobacteraceae bacterium]|jgi:CBS domain-containing protein